MLQIFTSKLHTTTTKLKKEKFVELSVEPSKNVIDNILNFSKNLEVKQSTYIDFIEVIKS